MLLEDDLKIQQPCVKQTFLCAILKLKGPHSIRALEAQMNRRYIQYLRIHNGGRHLLVGHLQDHLCFHWDQHHRLISTGSLKCTSLVQITLEFGANAQEKTLLTWRSRDAFQTVYCRSCNWRVGNKHLAGKSRQTEIRRIRKHSSSPLYISAPRLFLISFFTLPHLCFLKVRQEQSRSNKILLLSSPHPGYIGIKASLSYVKGHSSISKAPTKHSL